VPRTRATLAAGGHASLGYGDYVLAINWDHGNNPAAPLLNPIIGILPAQQATIARLERFGADNFDPEGGLSFDIDKAKMPTLRQWFITGLDRDSGPFDDLLQRSLPNIQFERPELIGLTRVDGYAANNQKTTLLIETYVACPTEYGRQQIEALLDPGNTRFARATETEIMQGERAYGGGTIHHLAASLLTPRFRYDKVQ